MTTFLKFVHIAAIGVWCGGLLVLPYLFWQSRLAPASGFEFDRLHRLVRFVYVSTTSPAAFIAIGSGTALIFLQSTFQEWFSLKMALVGAMVMLHVVAGLFSAQVFEHQRRVGTGASVVLTGLYLALIVAILWVVLAKPHIDSAYFGPDVFRPGALGQFFFDVTRIPTP